MKRLDLLLLALIAALAPAAARAPLTSPGQLIPEHRRTLSHVVFNSTADAHAEMIQSLPLYTQVTHFAEGWRIPEMDETRQALGGRRHQLVGWSYRKHGQVGYSWTQDIMEALVREEGTTVIIPRQPQGQRRGLLFNEAGIRTVESELRWAGGDITYDVMNGKQILFVGENAIARNTYERIPRERVLSILQREFEVDEAMPVPYKPGGPIMHNDLGFIIVDDGKVVVPSLEHLTWRDFAAFKSHMLRKQGELQEQIRQLHYLGPGAADLRTWYKDLDSMGLFTDPISRLRQTQTDLQNIQTMFADLGYTVHPMNASPWQISTWDSYANGVVYTHLETGNRTIKLPMYVDGSLPYERAWNEEAVAFFTALGLDVEPSPHLWNRSHGSWHCRMEVLR